MTLGKKILGQAGEDWAADVLKKKGYRILEKNFRHPLGEIDIIALHEDTVCFIEVKTRTTASRGTPLEAITPRKKHKLTQLALVYLKRKNWLKRKARFDMAAVTTDEDQKPCVKILENAFDAMGPYLY
ncbi:MAG: YraN family protein [Candidatus Omnitrophota bacterium]